MAVQCALIVDDSKTAQLRLKKMLKRFDIEVDVSFSAEEALRYLSYRVPTVIFMDHHMEGMDGLEALKIIKANPDTAMVPVIMYTSQRGDVYVGQARALGALDILSKEVIKPSGLEQVLNKLSIFPRDVEQEKSQKAPYPPRAAESTDNVSSSGKDKQQPSPPPLELIKHNTPSPLQEADLVHIRKQVARLFETHTADIRNQIAENSTFIIRQLGGEIQRLKNRPPNVDVAPPALKEPVSPKKTSPTLTNALLALIFVALTSISIQLPQSYQIVASETADNTESLHSDGIQDLFFAGDPEKSTASQDIAHYTALLKTLNPTIHFAYAQPPLGKEQVTHLQNLVLGLDNAGFRGQVNVNIHFGNFCVERSTTGEWTVAGENMPLSQCVFAEDVQPESTADEIISAAYIQFEQSSVPIQNGTISIVISVDEFNDPLRSYPAMDGTSEAGEWNAVAATNNHISINLSP